MSPYLLLTRRRISRLLLIQVKHNQLFYDKGPLRAAVIDMRTMVTLHDIYGNQDECQLHLTPMHSYVV